MKALLYKDTFPRLAADLREHPGRWLSRLVFLLGPWVSLWMVEILNQNDVFRDLEAWQVLMNMVWYYSLFAVCRLVLGRNRRAAALGAVLSFLAGLLNHYILRFRGRILFPADISGWRTAANVAGDFDYSFDQYIVQAAVLLTAYLFLVWMCVPQKKRARLPLWWSLLLWAAMGGYSYAFFCTGMLPALDIYTQQWVTQRNGFLLNFTVAMRYSAVDKPEGYSRAEAESWETGDVAGLGKDVNVIMVMNEAFSDITDFDAFTYSEENDPLKNLHDIQADPNCLSGHVVVPGFAGGTAATEFDVLTGIQGATLSPGTISPFRAVNRNLDSLFRVFGSDGYQTSFLHPGYAWFYNRENVYRWFGAQEILFADQMENVEYKGTGTWVSDEYLTGLIQEKFEAAAANGAPYFNYTTTIQNHMSYTADKYGAGYEFPPVETSAELSEEAETLLKVYIEGVRDADQMLGDLRDYFAQREEPVILVYFGDHLPYLGDGRLAYNELGMDMQPDGGDISRFIATYETPYVIWANDAAAEQLDWENAVSALDLPEDGSISACYLGATVLELTGRGASSPWFSYLTEARRELPILHKTVCQQGDGTLCKQTELSEDQQALIAKMRRWSYYKMKYKDVG